MSSLIHRSLVERMAAESLAQSAAQLVVKVIMARKAKDLSALEVARLSGRGHHAVGGVAGLYLYVTDSGARSWVLRIMIGDKRRHMGLGSFSEVTLAQARSKAREAKGWLDQGVDPIERRTALMASLKAQQVLPMTFEQAATAYIATRESEWKNLKHRAPWASTLKAYAYLHIGTTPVQDVTTEQVLAILRPIWTTKSETASRLRGRIEAVLEWATSQSQRSGDNPARWKGHLDALLPSQAKARELQLRGGPPVAAMPELMCKLRSRPGTAARALEFAVLTAVPSEWVTSARWDEFDLNARIWTVPAERLISCEPYQIPLSHSAISVLKSEVIHVPRDPRLVFPRDRDSSLSEAELAEVLKRLDLAFGPDDFRRTFREWAVKNGRYSQALVDISGVDTPNGYTANQACEDIDRSERSAIMDHWDQFIMQKASKIGFPFAFRNF